MMTSRFWLFWVFPAILLIMFGGCATVPGPQVAEEVRPLVAEQELDDSELLNVSIRIFDPGELPTGEDERRGLSPEIREAEARFIPVHLKYTMQRSGYWGMVRVVPDDDLGAEVLVKGKIDYSDGESAVLTVEVYDARGKQWFSRQYAETSLLEEHDGIEPEKLDIFQDLFTSIANDLVEARNQLTSKELATIRQVAEIQFAESMAPEAFSGYLEKDVDGYWQVARLPALDDPMLERLRAVRTRDEMLIDAINGYYDVYYRDLWQPYSDWRKFRRDEVATMRELEREALTRQLLGVAAIVGAIALGAGSDSDTRIRTDTLRDVMIMGGAASVYSGYQKSQEAEMNKEAITELGASFQSEAEPLVIEVQGETIRLSGSAEEQYARWRSMLREIYARETGLTKEIPPSEQEPADSRQR
jgi:hypothetical protein